MKVLVSITNFSQYMMSYIYMHIDNSATYPVSDSKFINYVPYFDVNQLESIRDCISHKN